MLALGLGERGRRIAHGQPAEIANPVKGQVIGIVVVAGITPGRSADSNQIGTVNLPVDVLKPDFIIIGEGFSFTIP